jgi:hypothetical protein
MIVETTFVILILMLLGFVVYFLMLRRLKKAKEAEFISLLNHYGSVEEIEDKTILTLNSETYQVVFFYVPFQGELTINSKTIWETKVGRHVTFTNQTDLVNAPLKKLVIVYPSAQKLKRFINENELVFIKHDDLIHNMHIVLGEELSLFLEAKTNDL